MASTDIQLNFINRSNESDNTEVVIFQKNAAANSRELAIAWLVIKNCGQGDNHPFTYSSNMEVGASDSYGNFTPRLPAENGQMFAMRRTSSGDTLSPDGSSTSPDDVQVLNGLAQGAIRAGIYKDGKLLARSIPLAPEQKAAFEFKPTIWIGVAMSQIEEGGAMNSAIISNINTEISLLGIASADMVMTGGGAGPESRPISFDLENIVYS